MEHVVFFPAADGTPGFRRVPSLEDAVRLVEHLHNVEGVTSASVHALTAVPLQVRTYFKVEVPVAPVAAAPLVDVAPLVPVVEQAPEPALEQVVEPVVVEAPVEVVAEAPVEAAVPAVEPVEEAPALTLVEDLPQLEELRAPEEEPVLASVNGSGTKGAGDLGSLGFFA